MKRIKFFIEDENLKEIDYLKNLKSNLILNLKLKNQKEYLQDIGDIGVLELQIADLEIGHGNYRKASLNIFSAINFFSELSKETSFSIALRAIIEEVFSNEVKQEFFKFLKSVKLKKPNLTHQMIQLFKFIINQYAENQYEYKKQNINKVPLYIFSKLSFSENLIINIPQIGIFSHPYYSPEINLFLNSINNLEIIKIKGTNIFPHKNYTQFVFNEAKVIRNEIGTYKKGLIEKILLLIEDFSRWKTTEIIKWEKKLGLMDFFKTGEFIR